ncbi:MAG: hypothetical protein WC641_08070 [Patescibacteria group bacterium]
MSRHYLVMRQSSVVGQENGVDEVLRKLIKTRPELAQKLRAIAWAPIIQAVARRALERAAAQCRCSVAEKYDNSSTYGKASGQPLDGGTSVGVLRGSIECSGSHIQLGVTITGTTLSYYSNAISSESNQLKAWKKAFESAYKEEALKATLSLLGGEVTREERGDVVILETKIKGGAR